MLHTPAQPVETVDEGLRVLAHDMMETMAEAPGVGLAAPQVGVPLRLFVYGWSDEDEVRHEGVAVNPDLWIAPPPVTEADDDDSEGCLSFPGERFPLVRAQRALLRAHDLHGEPFEITTSGWLARIFQHEFDHLDGVIYLDRLEEAHRKASNKARRKNGWGSPGLSWLPGTDHWEG